MKICGWRVSVWEAICLRTCGLVTFAIPPTSNAIPRGTTLANYTFNLSIHVSRCQSLWIMIDQYPSERLCIVNTLLSSWSHALPNRVLIYWSKTHFALPILLASIGQSFCGYPSYFLTHMQKFASKWKFSKIGSPNRPHCCCFYT